MAEPAGTSATPSAARDRRELALYVVHADSLANLMKEQRPFTEEAGTPITDVIPHSGSVTGSEWRSGVRAAGPPGFAGCLAKVTINRS